MGKPCCYPGVSVLLTSQVLRKPKAEPVNDNKHSKKDVGFTAFYNQENPPGSCTLTKVTGYFLETEQARPRQGRKDRHVDAEL